MTFFSRLNFIKVFRSWQQLYLYTIIYICMYIYSCNAQLSPIIIYLFRYIFLHIYGDEESVFIYYVHHAISWQTHTHTHTHTHTKYYTFASHYKTETITPDTTRHMIYNMLQFQHNTHYISGTTHHMHTTYRAQHTTYQAQHITYTPHARQGHNTPHTYYTYTLITTSLLHAANKQCLALLFWRIWGSFTDPQCHNILSSS